jgi:hypothetical protein
MKHEITLFGSTFFVSGDQYFSAPTANYAHTNMGEVTFKDHKGNFAVLCNEEEEYEYYDSARFCDWFPQELEEIIERELGE